MTTITINTNHEFTNSDSQLERFKELVDGYIVDDMGYKTEWEDIGTTYSWKCYENDISDDDGFFIQGILERAWNEAHP